MRVTLAPVGWPWARPSAIDGAVLLLLALMAGGGLVCLAAARLPAELVAGRILGGVGQASTGTLAQDLQQHLAERLWLAGVALLVLSVAVLALRRPLAELLLVSVRDLSTARPARALRLLASEPLLLILLVFGIGVRVTFLDQPMRTDEARTFIGYASRPLYYALSVYLEPNNHVFHTLLVHVSTRLFGDAPWAVRLPAFVAGSLLIPATYALGRLLYGRWPALLAASAVAGSSYLVEYSTNARGYTLQTLSFLVLFSVAVWAVRKNSPSAVVAAAVVAALGFYTVPTMVYSAAIVAAWVTTQRTHLRRVSAGHLLAAGLIMAMLVFVLYLPLLLVSGPDRLALKDEYEYFVPLTWAALGDDVPTTIASTWAYWNRDVPLLVTAVLLSGFVVATVRRLDGPVPILALVVGASVPLMVAERVVPPERVWFFLLPLYLLAASAGLVWLGTRLPSGRPAPSEMLSLGLVAAIAVWLGGLTLTSRSILASPETGTFPDAEQVAWTLAGQIGDRDLVLLSGPTPEHNILYAPMQYYFQRVGLPRAALERSPAIAERLFVVMERDSASALPKLLRERAVPVQDWGPPTSTARYAQAELFVLDRRQPQRPGITTAIAKSDTSARGVLLGLPGAP